MNEIANIVQKNKIPIHLDRLVVAIADPNLVFPKEVDDYDQFPELSSHLNAFLSKAYPDHLDLPTEQIKKFETCRILLEHLEESGYVNKWHKREKKS